MIRILFGKRGFTLIEVITSLVVLAIIGVIAGMGIVTITEGYVFTKENAEGAQKSQIAMARIVKELAATNQISSGNATSITFNSKSPPVKERTISWNNADDTLSIDSDLILDNVSLFNLAYCEFYDDAAPASSYSSASTAMIQVTLGLKGADDVTVITFVDRVFLLKVMTGIGA